MENTFLLLPRDDFSICANFKPLWDYIKCKLKCQQLLLPNFLCPLIRLCHSPRLSWTQNSAHLLNLSKRIQPQKGSERWEPAFEVLRNHRGGSSPLIHSATIKKQTLADSAVLVPKSFPDLSITSSPRFSPALLLTGFQAPGSSPQNCPHFSLPSAVQTNFLYPATTPPLTSSLMHLPRISKTGVP